jgi:hypothetical protein
MITTLGNGPGPGGLRTNAVPAYPSRATGEICSTGDTCSAITGRVTAGAV